MNNNYAASGVDYDTLDAAKRTAIASASSIPAVLEIRNATALDASRGEPAFIVRIGEQNIATVLECLGTKSRIARVYQEESGKNHFDSIGYDTVAAIVNDVICVGALPVVVNAYFATGSPEWYQVEGRFEALTMGWARGCEDAGATWGGGESPGLSGVVVDGEIDLAGSAVGVIPEGVDPILGQALQAGDEIVFIGSTGLHANGASLVRKLAGELADGYSTKMPSGTEFGEGVLRASETYVPLVDEMLRQRVPVSYLSHVTGHGLRKLMRANRKFTYRIDQLLPVPETLAFMVDKLDMSQSDAYGTFNMGVGFAVYCQAGTASDVEAIARSLGYEAVVAGKVEEGDQRVIIEPLGIEYSADQLQLR